MNSRGLNELRPAIQHNFSALWYPATFPLWLESCLEIALPPHCSICGRPVRRASVCYRCRPPLDNIQELSLGKCPSCFVSLTTEAIHGSCETCKLYPLLTSSVRFLWEYEGLPRDFIRTMKYRPSISLAAIGGKILAETVSSLFPGSHWDTIMPIPSSLTMLSKRLFHPCVELAHPVAKRLQIPLIKGLHHSTQRAPQASLNHRERLRKPQSLFYVNKQLNLRDSRILLIEDVITTGATISAAAFVLKRAGARKVDVLSLARTHVWTRFRRIVHESFHTKQNM